MSTERDEAAAKLLQYVKDNPEFEMCLEVLVLIAMGSSNSTDNVSEEKRSWIMSRIKGKGTKPELIVKGFLEESGIQFVYQPVIEGKPDFLLEGNTAMFVNGCFWHGCPVHYKEPKSNVEFWRKKISRNKERQEEVTRKLLATGFMVLVVWEHSLKDNSYKDMIRQVIGRR